jgi:hypothetical protein
MQQDGRKAREAREAAALKANISRRKAGQTDSRPAGPAVEKPAETPGDVRSDGEKPSA